MARQQWGVILVGALVIGWFAPYQPLWVSMLAAFLVGLFSSEAAKVVDKWLNR